MLVSSLSPRNRSYSARLFSAPHYGGALHLGPRPQVGIPRAQKCSTRGIEEHVTCWFHHCPPGGGPIAPNPSLHTPRGGAPHLGPRPQVGKPRLRNVPLGG